MRVRVARKGGLERSGGTYMVNVGVCVMCVVCAAQCDCECGVL